MKNSRTPWLQEDTVLWVSAQNADCESCGRAIKKSRALIRHQHDVIRCFRCVDDDPDLVFLEAGNGSVTRQVSTRSSKRYVVARRKHGTNTRLGVLVSGTAFDLVCADRDDVVMTEPRFLAGDNVDAFRISTRPKRRRRSARQKTKTAKPNPVKAQRPPRPSELDTTSQWGPSRASRQEVLESIKQHREERAKFRRDRRCPELKRPAKRIGPDSVIIAQETKKRGNPTPVKRSNVRTHDKLVVDLQNRFPSLRRGHAEKVAAWAFKNLADVETASPGAILSRYLRRWNDL